ncbi:hypothetical protein KQI30_00925 [Clostridium bornimense]|uniref:hypothetical protein n=1 Tax=Clostridium bornimense TaxID=1216932 RepID=UPI001C125EAD|nr:hypothetical protein [Clostridium bornimense]MBU5314840.1 hypothetical protein [Clostridium bornimense]
MLTALFYILIAISLLTFCIISIWSFVLFNRFYNQIKYKNYLLEKLNQNISSLAKNNKED